MEEVLLPNLPNEIGIQCIARVPRSFHPNLSLVCRSWRSLLRSHLFYSTRSHLKCTQQFLYFNAIFDGSSVKWYVLDICDGNPRKIKPLPPIPSPIGLGFAWVVLGSRLYVLDCALREPNVWVFDARANSWEAGPIMMIHRLFPHITVVNGKIYVVGGGSNAGRRFIYNPLGAVFDPGLGLWTPLHSPMFLSKNTFIVGCTDVRGKLLILTRTEAIFFDPESSSWSIEKKSVPCDLLKIAAVVDGVFYCYDSFYKIKGYDLEENRWKELNVVDMEIMHRPCHMFRLANVEGSLWVIWQCSSKEKDFDRWNLEGIEKNPVLREFDQIEKDFVLRECKQDEIYFVVWEIMVRKESDGGLQGSIVRSKVLLTIPNTSIVRDFLALGL
ncbi:F-box/kelch-repeat protein SKIP6-like [Tasmannia lanceolata]|uniref:F-box/kelch-repeat protein SKIP6-like n=1 Tax=Tasmannia lanceolata TaxID=3420 RepID=UPI004062EA51